MTDRAEAGGQVFYRFETDDGRLVIVDSLSKVPTTLRDDVERIDFGGAVARPKQGSYNVVGASGQADDGGQPVNVGFGGIELSSFGLGVGAGLFGAALLYFIVGRRGGGLGRLVFGGVVVLGLAALAGGAYLGWMRRATGVGQEAFASPARIVEDAKEAVRGVEAQRRAQEQLLEETRELAK